MTMNLLQMQDALKDMSDAQVSQQLKGPAGQVPQFLLLAELSRRKRTRSDAERQQAGQQAPDQTVKDEAVNAAGMPQGPLPEIARSMAPKTSVAQNTGIARMASGGAVRRMADGGIPSAFMSDNALKAYASKLGMTMEQYWASLPPAQQQSIAGDAQGRMTRDLMIPLEPVGNGYAYPTQADLDAKARTAAAQPDVFPMDEPRGLATVAAGAGASGIGAPGAQALSGPGGGRVGMQTGAPMPAPAPPGYFAQLGQGYYDLYDRGLRALYGVPPSSGASTGPAGMTGAPGVVPPPGQTSSAPAAAPPGAPVVTPPGQQATQTQGQSAPGGAGSVGAPSAGGTSAAVPGSYEQALIDALAEVDKRAEQDKWMAIAMAGLQTLGAQTGGNGLAAIGQGYASGLGMYKDSRDQAAQDKLGLQGQLEQWRQQQQAMSMAQAKAASGGGSGAMDLSALTGGLTDTQFLGQVDKAQERALETLATIPVDENGAPLPAFADQYQSAKAVLERADQLRGMMSPGLAALTQPIAAPAGPSFNVSDQ